MDAGPEAALARVAALHGDVPVDQGLDAMQRAGELSAEERALARSYVEGYYAADISRASAEWIGALERASRALHGDDVARIEGGYLGVLAGILASAQKRAPGLLRLSTVVTEIRRWRSGLVESRKGTGLAPRLAARLPSSPFAGRAPGAGGATGATSFTPACTTWSQPAPWCRDRCSPSSASGSPSGFARPPRTMLASAVSASRTFPEAPCPPGDYGATRVLTGWAGGPLAQELSTFPPDAWRGRS